MPFSAEDFPDRFDFLEAQPRIYKMWEEAKSFHSEPDSKREPFTIVIPPPNVTGALHLGHALNNTLQDSLVRMKRMQGYNALWMPGTDHAGIATQAVVERRLKEQENKTRHDLGREALVERIWEWKHEYEGRIIGQLKQMGCSCDWDRTRFTLDETCARAVRETFFDLFAKKRIYRGKRLVNWDTHLQTAVSNDEVFNETIKGSFWHIRYPVIDPKPGEPEFVVIATTRPETLLGDTAVAVHPDPARAIEKVIADLEEKLAKAPEKEVATVEKQLKSVRERQQSMLPALEQLRDMANDGRHLMLPLQNRPIPLVCDKWAKPQLGSGCVKITPAHDANDYEVGRRLNLEMINILLADGTLNEKAGEYQGLSMQAARKRVVADLEELELLQETEKRSVELPHSDRSKTPIEPFLADQWFVAMDELAQSAIDAVDDGRVTINPPRYATAYVDWLAEKRDWCISRNLWWGHQIPVWSRVCTSESELADLEAELKSNDAFAAGNASLQIESNADDDTERFATVHVCIREDEDSSIAATFESLGFERVEDVLDTWFSSGLWPHSTLGWPEKTPELDYYYPTSTLITSRDIITLWVARMVLMGLNNVGEIPFREVFIHPKILDGDGETMSKSKGNGVDPLDVIQKFGADALRFGLAYLATDSQDVRMPIQFECPHCEAAVKQTKKNRTKPTIQCPKCNQSFSTQWAETAEDKSMQRGPVLSDRFERPRNFVNKLWNASRFAMLNLDGYEPAPVADAELEVEDRWLLSRLATVTESVTAALEQYRYAEASRTLIQFAWDEFCSFYLEMTKARLQDEATRASSQRVLAHALDIVLKLLHPIMPFITEEIWRHFAQAAPQRGLEDPQAPDEILMTASWPKPDLNRRDEAIESQFALFQEVLGAVREIRNRQNIGPKEEITFAIRCDDATADLLKPLEPYFESMGAARVSEYSPDVQPPLLSAAMSVGGIELFVDLSDHIDIDAEIARLEKEAENVSKFIKGKKSKLENPNFVERAKPEVVQRERDQLVQLESQSAMFAKSLAQLRSQSTE